MRTAIALEKIDRTLAIVADDQRVSIRALQRLTRLNLRLEKVLKLFETVLTPVAKKVKERPEE